MFNTRNEVLLLKQQNSLVDGNQGLQLEAQAAAIAAVNEAVASPPIGVPVIGALGDSIMADAFSVGGIWTSWGWLAWARRYLGGSVSMPSKKILAVGGSTLDDVISNQLPKVASGFANYIVLGVGINSLGSISTDVFIDKYKIIINALTGKGIKVIAIPVRVKGSGDAITGDSLLQQARVNKWLCEYAIGRSDLAVFDTSQYIIDYATGNAQSQYLRDNLHDNQLSAEIIGRKFATWLQARIQPQSRLFGTPGDVYHATKNPTGNLLTNGILAGSGGTKVNGASGVAPNGWRLGRTTGSATHTVTGSTGFDPEFSTLPRFSMAFGGTGDSHSSFVDQGADMTAILSPGDVVVAEIECSVNLATGFRAVALKLDAASAAFAELAATWDGYLSGNGNLGALNQKFTLRTDPLVIPVGFRYVSVSVFGYAQTTGTPSGTLSLARASLRKVV